MARFEVDEHISLFAVLNQAGKELLMNNMSYSARRSTGLLERANKYICFNSNLTLTPLYVILLAGYSVT